MSSRATERHSSKSRKEGTSPWSHGDGRDGCSSDAQTGAARSFRSTSTNALARLGGWIAVATSGPCIRLCGERRDVSRILSSGEAEYGGGAIGSTNRGTQRLRTGFLEFFKRWTSRKMPSPLPIRSTPKRGLSRSPAIAWSMRSESACLEIERFPCFPCADETLLLRTRAMKRDLLGGQAAKLDTTSGVSDSTLRAVQAQGNIVV